MRRVRQHVQLIISMKTVYILNEDCAHAVDLYNLNIGIILTVNL